MTISTPIFFSLTRKLLLLFSLVSSVLLPISFACNYNHKPSLNKKEKLMICDECFSYSNLYVLRCDPKAFSEIKGKILINDSLAIDIQKLGVSTDSATKILVWNNSTEKKQKIRLSEYNSNLFMQKSRLLLVHLEREIDINSIENNKWILKVMKPCKISSDGLTAFDNHLLVYHQVNYDSLKLINNFKSLELEVYKYNSNDHYYNVVANNSDINEICMIRTALEKTTEVDSTELNIYHSLKFD